jgi:putative oxidoreductase
MSNLQEKLTAIGLLWLRTLLGLGLIYHGYGKIFGGQMEGFIGFVGKLGFPLPFLFGWLAALSEFVGGILIILGFGTRIASFFVTITMFTAVFIAHKNDPLKVKELALAYLTMATTVLISGAGYFSVDKLICKLCKTKN